MKLVGDAFKHNSESIDPSQKVVVLGISNWCTILHKEDLIRKKVLYNGYKSYSNLKVTFSYNLFAYLRIYYVYRLRIIMWSNIICLK